MVWAWMMAAAQAATPQAAIGYHGDLLTHPGVVGRAEILAVSGERGSLNWEVQGGVHWHPSLMTSLQARTGLGARWVGPRRGTWGAFAHVGAARAFWTSPTFAVDQGAVVRRPLSGDQWLVVASGLELGRATSSPVVAGWAFRPQLGLRAPTYHGVGIDLGLELSLRLGGEA